MPDELYVQCLDAYELFGLYGFSVYVGNDLHLLGGHVCNRQISVARVGDLTGMHCDFAQTRTWPDHTLVVDGDVPTALTMTVDNPNPKERRR